MRKSICVPSIWKTRWAHGWPGVLALVLGAAAGGCSVFLPLAGTLGLSEYVGVTGDEYNDILAWLECEECRNGELDRVREIGPRAKHVLGSVLRDVPPDWVELKRRKLRILSNELGHSQAESDAYVARYSEYYVATTQIRAVEGLAVVEEWGAFRQALRQAPNRSYRLDVLALIQERLFQSMPADQLSTTGHVTGRVSDPITGNPAPGLRVALSRCLEAGYTYSPPQPGECIREEPMGQFLTDSVGAFRIPVDGSRVPGLPEGIYEFDPDGDRFPSMLVLLVGSSPREVVTWH